MQNKIKHLEFIQNVIDRQARNSFLLKGWIVTLFVGILVLPLRSGSFDKSLLAYFLIIVFWLLDSYYLWKEREFRCLYKKVRTLKESQIDFDMNTSEIAKKDGCSWIDAFKSKPFLIFYSSLLIFTYIFFSGR